MRGGGEDRQSWRVRPLGSSERISGSFNNRPAAAGCNGVGPYFYLSLSTPKRPEDGDSEHSGCSKLWLKSQHHSCGGFFFQNIGALRLRWKYDSVFWEVRKG